MAILKVLFYGSYLLSWWDFSLAAYVGGMGVRSRTEAMILGCHPVVLHLARGPQ